MKELDRWDWQRRAVRAEERAASAEAKLKALELESLADKMSISTLQENKQRAEAKIQALQAKSLAVKASRVAKQKLRPQNRPMK